MRRKNVKIAVIVIILIVVLSICNLSNVMKKANHTDCSINICTNQLFTGNDNFFVFMFNNEYIVFNKEFNTFHPLLLDVFDETFQYRSIELQFITNEYLYFIYSDNFNQKEFYKVHLVSGEMVRTFGSDMKFNSAGLFDIDKLLKLNTDAYFNNKGSKSSFHFLSNDEINIKIYNDYIEIIYPHKSTKIYEAIDDKNVHITKDHLYFQNKMGDLFCFTFRTEDCNKLTEDTVDGFDVNDTLGIYYKNLSDYSKLYFYDFVDQKSTKYLDESVDDIKTSNGMIYFKQNNGIYTIYNDDKLFVTDFNDNWIVSAGNVVIYNSDSLNESGTLELYTPFGERKSIKINMQ